MSEELSLKEMRKEYHGTLKSYLIGFAGSFAMTITSFLLVATQSLPKTTLIYTVSALAFLQALFQMFYFLHLGKEAKPQWETLVFCFMVLILLIIVAGSLWIMYDLHERMMPM